MDDETKALATRLFSEYWDSYRTRTTLFRDMEIAGRWFAMWVKNEAVTAPIAASWARLGFLPEEAAPLIADGITPAMQREMERHARDEAGGREALAEQRIQELVDLGQLVDPARVSRIPDPVDPGVEIIAIRDDDKDKP